MGRKHSDAIADANHALLYQTLAIWLDADRDIIAERITTRVNRMLADGLIGENRRLYERLTPGPRLFEIGIGQAIGFKEFRQCYASDYDTAADRAERDAAGAAALRAATLRYARQQTRAIPKWIGCVPGLPTLRLDTSGTVVMAPSCPAPVADCSGLCRRVAVDAASRSARRAALHRYITVASRVA